MLKTGLFTLSFKWCSSFINTVLKETVSTFSLLFLVQELKKSSDNKRMEVERKCIRLMIRRLVKNESKDTLFYENLAGVTYRWKANSVKKMFKKTENDVYIKA